MEKGAAPASARSPIVSKPLIPAAKNGVAERASRGRGTVCRSVIISVHTCGAESLTKNLSMSAPRLTGRPRVEALVACGAHQIQTQGKCTRQVGGRESGRGRERERACVPVPLSCGGRACTILLQEGGGAQSCSQRRHVNEYGPIAAHTGCTIAGLPRFLTVSRRTSVRKAHGGRSFPGPSAYCVVHCWLVLESELGVANFQLPRQLLSVCRRLRCDLGPETSTNTAHQLQGELAIPVPEYGHPHATNNGACSRDAPGPTNSLPLHPRIGAAERRPHRCSAHQHGSDGGHGMGHLPQDSQTLHRHGASVRAQRGTLAPAPRARVRTTRHARTCNGATVE